MRFPSRKLATEDELYTAAIHTLARRSYSVFEMRTYLERRAENKDVIHNILERLKNLDYLDDARYARQFVRRQSESRKQGAFRIARELRARGVPDRHIEAALAERSTQSDDRALVRDRLERRLKSMRGPLDERRVASLYRSLLRAGFPADTIRRELRELTRKQPDAITNDPGEDDEA